MEAGSGLMLQSQTAHETSLLYSDFEDNLSKVKPNEVIREKILETFNGRSNAHKTSMFNPTFKHHQHIDSLILDADS